MFICAVLFDTAGVFRCCNLMNEGDGSISAHLLTEYVIK